MNQYYLGKKPSGEAFLSRVCSGVRNCVVLYEHTALPLYRSHIKWQKQLICVVGVCFNSCTRRCFFFRLLTDTDSLLNRLVCCEFAEQRYCLCLNHAGTHPPDPQRARDWVLSSDVPLLVIQAGRNEAFNSKIKPPRTNILAQQELALHKINVSYVKSCICFRKSSGVLPTTSTSR